MMKHRRVLVIDGSRVVRATLTKHLRDDFEILEENNGESAWQALMLDANITVVISGIHTPKLEAYDLLARLRSSSIRRLQIMPFVLIVSNLEDQAEREYDRARGIAGFITKTMKKSEIVTCLNDLLVQHECAQLVESQTIIDIPEPPEPETSIPIFPDFPKLVATPPPPPPPPTEIEGLMGREQLKAVLSDLTFDDPQEQLVCALVFGIDKRDGLVARFGEDVVKMIGDRFAKMLVGKLAAQDVIGRFHGESLAIVSTAVDLRQGMRFGKRVCRSLANGQITIKGEKIRLTASVGVASTSDDKVANGNELFALAEQRLEQAQACGGNVVSMDIRTECPFSLLGKDKHAVLAAQIGSLGLKILPLIQAMDHELSLALPLKDIEKKLRQRVKAEEKSS